MLLSRSDIYLLLTASDDPYLSGIYCKHVGIKASVWTQCMYVLAQLCGSL